MNLGRSALYVSAGIIVFLTLLSGPVLSGVDFTSERTSNNWAGSGSVTVDDVRLGSGDFVFEKGGFGTETRYLEAPDAKVDISNSTGQTTIQYILEIPSLNGFTKMGLTLLDNETHGVYSASLDAPGFAPEKIDKSSYKGEVSVEIHNGTNSRTVFRKNVTIRVQE